MTPSCSGFGLHFRPRLGTSRNPITRILLSSLLAVFVTGMGRARAQVPNPGSLPQVTRWSFEAGLPPDWSIRFRAVGGYAEEPAIEWLDPRPRIDDHATTGTHALALQIPPRGRVLAHTPAVAASAVSPSVFSVAVRSDASSRVVLRLFESVLTGGKAYGPRMRPIIVKEFPVGAAWTRLSVEGTGEHLVFGEIEAEGPRTLFLDDAAIERQAPARFDAPVELVIDPVEEAGGVAGVMRPGETVHVGVKLSRAPLSSERLILTVTNPREQPVRVVRGRVPGAAPASASFVVSPRLAGPYLVRATLEGSGGRVIAWGQRAFSVLPSPAPPGAVPTLLGTHTRLDRRHLAIAARLGFRYLRLHDASMIGQWITVEPAPGELHYFDEAIDHAHRAGFSILGVLEATPRWASSAPEATGWYEARAFPPRDPAVWRAYVRNTVSHYRGRIDAWEVWNEPYLDEFWRGTPEQYGALLDDTARILAGIGPPVLLASGAPEGKRVEWSRTALCAGKRPCGLTSRLANLLSAVPKDEHGGSPSIGLAFHPYDPRLVEKLGRGDAVGERVATFQSIVSDRVSDGVSHPVSDGATDGARAPLWATEGTVLGASESMMVPPAPLPPPRIERDAEGMAGWAADLLSAGALHVFVYQLVESGYASDADLALLDPDGTPRPAALALATLGITLGPRRFARTVTTSAFTAHLFTAPGHSTLAVIAAANGASLRVSDARRFRDVFGNPLVDGMTPRFAYLELEEAEDAEGVLRRSCSPR